ALPAVEAFENVGGRGVRGHVEGRALLLGDPRWLAEQGSTDAQGLTAQGGQTTVALAEPGGPLIAMFDLADRLRADAAAAVARLQALGLKLVMLTGDHPAAAERIARAAGIAEIRAQVRPQDKAAVVEALKHRGERVGMVGDGINDAPALAAADVGIALASGADIAMEAADLTLMRPDLMAVADALLLARAVMRKIRQNLFLAFFYNVLALPLAALGYLNPVIAGAAMALSSV
ncbi:MAG: HAD-IC family P-type ATPase, partial [Geminicoccaceae bacterium]|nr:HAD-IC family P-type ATPase [Geminicoccaceae bacterium]